MPRPLFNKHVLNSCGVVISTLGHELISSNYSTRRSVLPRSMRIQRKKKPAWRRGGDTCVLFQKVNQSSFTQRREKHIQRRDPEETLSGTDGEKLSGSGWQSLWGHRWESTREWRPESRCGGVCTSVLDLKDPGGKAGERQEYCGGLIRSKGEMQKEKQTLKLLLETATFCSCGQWA